MATRFPDVPLTKHCKRRFRERMKLPTRALQRMANEAFAIGARAEDMPAPARHKILSQQARYCPSGEAEVRVHRGFIFIFDRKLHALVTLYPLGVPDFYLRED
jgi:hypothetical protein